MENQREDCAWRFAELARLVEQVQAGLDHPQVAELAVSVAQIGRYLETVLFVGPVSNLTGEARSHVLSANTELQREYSLLRAELSFLRVSRSQQSQDQRLEHIRRRLERMGKYSTDISAWLK